MVTAVSDKQFEAFGRIIYWYAAVEVGIKYCVAGMLGTDWDKGLIACATLTASNLGNTAKALAPETLEPAQAKKLSGLVSRWMSFNTLRMQIAHHRWRAGTKEGSIKATYFDVRKGKVELFGFDDKQTEYTAEELRLVAMELSQLNEELKDFLVDSGLHPGMARYRDQEKP